MERLRQQPGISSIMQVIETLPRITAWVVLSIGCVGLLVYEGRDVGLTTGNWLALIVMTVAVTGLCVVIITLEDEDEAGDEHVVVQSAQTEQAKPAGADTSDSGSNADDTGKETSADSGTESGV
ncbi:MAG: hypothetical protein GYB65_12340 [Chloroflexi bacterium]|nr:hypothetical protein [Chloroflexota bacterium]